MSSSEGGRHLVAVWDPTRTPDAMEATVRQLLALARANRSGALGDADDVCVWWGKIRSPNRQQGLVHLPEILQLDDWLRGSDRSLGAGDAKASDAGEIVADREVHLYLTDYRSLYVAHVAQVTKQDPRDDDDVTWPHVPPGVYPESVACDCWFLLFDVRRLVLDDTRAVVAELRKLRNTRYADRPVSLYGGMVELPLLTSRADGARWFDPETRERLTGGPLWVEFDAELSGVGAVAASLRDDVLGESTWLALDPATRLFVATSEKIFRDHRADAAFDFSPVVINLAKAYEVQLGLAFGAIAHRLPHDACLVNIDGRTVHVFERGIHGIGALAKALDDNASLRSHAARLLRNGDWVTASLPAILRDLGALRNAAAHGDAIDRESARRVRDAQLGVGTRAWLDELARVGAW